jgi:hypothetical protein
MKNFRRYAMLGMLALLVLSCGKKKSEQNSGGSALLQSDRGALMVTFPTRGQFDRDAFMAQVQISGGEDFDRLPRMPMGDLECILVLNIPPGSYQIVAHSWLRKRDVGPQYGGSLNNVVIKAGMVTVLGGKKIGSEPYPYPNLPLESLRSFPWMAQNAGALKEFVAGIKDKSAKG